MVKIIKYEPWSSRSSDIYLIQTYIWANISGLDKFVISDQIYILPKEIKLITYNLSKDHLILAHEAVRKYFSGEETKVIVDIASMGLGDFEAGVNGDPNVDLDKHNYQASRGCNVDG